jgi:signal transduction histidine kinase
VSFLASPSARRLEDLLLAAVNAIPTGSVSVFDRDLRYLFAGGSGLADVGLDPLRLVGRTLPEVFGEQAADAVRGHYARAFEGESVTFDLPVQDRIYQISAAPLPHRAAIVALAHEVTDVRRQQAELSALNRGKDDLLVTLAHELRQPLASMRMAVEVMRKRLGPEQGERAREVVARQLRQLERLTNDLLDARRLIAGEVDLRGEQFDLRTTVEEVLLLADGDVEAKHLSVEVTLPSSPVWVHADPNRLQQVFSNLVQNAVKFSPQGGRVTVSMVAKEATVTTAVRDHGVGIPADTLPHVFEMFVQANHQRGGLGVGLAVVKRLVEAHGGDVTASSGGPGTGAEFTVTLPLHQQEESEPAREGSDQAAGTARPADSER